MVFDRFNTCRKKRSNYMSSISISKLVKSALTISSNKQAFEINSAGQLCINSWLSIIMHLPHPDGDLPLADWQMYNNWGPKFKSYNVRTKPVWITKRGARFAAWPNVKACFSTLCIHSLCHWWGCGFNFFPFIICEKTLHSILVLMSLNLHCRVTTSVFTKNPSCMLSW